MTAAAGLEDSLVVADRWPAQITSPEGSGYTARVVLTTNPCELVVVRGGQPWERIGWVPAASTVTVDGSGTWAVSTPRGVFTVAGARGCRGCGGMPGEAALWHPWRAGRLPDDIGSTISEDL